MNFNNYNMEGKKPQVYLNIDEEDENSGMSRISFVDKPATQLVWNMFAEIEESYNDYPKSASENACRAIKYRDNNPELDCLTQVGWTRANQLCNGENLSLDTIGRMAAFKRHQQNKDVAYDEGCGGIAWDAWGGDEGIEWALRKMDFIRNNMSEENFEEKNLKQIITAPVMIAETPIPRFNPILGEYDVLFSEETIFNMMKKYFIENKINNINEQHDPTKVVDGVYMVESFIVGDRAKSELYPNIPKGSWMATFYIKDKEYYNKLMMENFNGFSLEGMFIEEYEDNMIGKLYDQVNKIMDSDLSDKEKENQIKKLLNIK
jgi:hypothetical protein